MDFILCDFQTEVSESIHRSLKFETTQNQMEIENIQKWNGIYFSKR